MKTNTEKQLEREIEESSILIDDKWMDAITKNIWSSVGTPEDNPIRIDWEGMKKVICKVKLEGYRLAKQEFNKKVEELKKKIETQIMFCSNSEEAHKIEGLQEAVKILDEALK